MIRLRGLARRVLISAAVCACHCALAGPFYEYEVVAGAGLSGASLVGSGPSINDQGVVAFMAADSNNFTGIWAGRGGSSNRHLTSSIEGAQRVFGFAVQINNFNQVVALDRFNGSPSATFVRVWDADSSGLNSLIVRGGSSLGSAFPTVLSHPSLSNTNSLENTTAGTGNGNGVCESGEPCVPAVVFSTLSTTATTLSVPKRLPGSINDKGTFTSVDILTPVRPMIADNGRVVVRHGGNSTDPIYLYQPDLSSFDVIAGGSGMVAFTALGLSPGISDDAVAVAFAADRGQGVGVFISVQDGESATRTLVRIAGENNSPPSAKGDLGIAGINPTITPAPVFIESVEIDSRVGIVHQQRGAAGLQDDYFVVTFIGTPNQACPALTCQSGEVFSKAKSLWSARIRVDIACIDPGPNEALNSTPFGDDKIIGERIYRGADGICNSITAGDDVQAINPGERFSYTVTQITPVAQVGDTISTFTVTDLAVHDPIALAGKDDSGTVREEGPGDHRIAFWAVGASGTFIVRASYLDTDGDGLLDHWEKGAAGGLDMDGDGVADFKLPAEALSKRKTLLLEYDYMDCAAGGCPAGTSLSKKPRTQSIANVKTAFKNAPVVNPDKSQGIDLLISEADADALRMMNVLIFGGRGPAPNDDFDDVKWGAGWSPCGSGRFGTTAERSNAKCLAILAGRRLAYRYLIFGQSYQRSGSGVAELRGNDFMVALASNQSRRGNFDLVVRDITTLFKTARDAEWIDLEAGTIMHELGHTLGLRHGGNEDAVNCKPNYVSVMQYRRQVNSAGVALGGVAPAVTRSGVGIARLNRKLDYSRDDLSKNGFVLDETSLNEDLGITGGASVASVAGQRIGFGIGPTGGRGAAITPADAPVDWNNDGTVGGTATEDINFMPYASILPGLSGGGCDLPTPGQTLRGFDDWQNLVYSFRESAGFSDGGSDDPHASSVAEMTSSDYLELSVGIADADGDGIDNSLDNCPTTPNPNQLDSNGNGVGDVCEDGPPPLRGDLDLDADVDRDDVNVLLRDLNKAVSQSACGAACDLNGDGRIDALDSRALVNLCTRTRCATQ